MKKITKGMISLVLAITLTAVGSSIVFARGANNASVGSLGKAYLNVKTSSVAAWTEANSSGIESSDYVEIASSAGGKKNTGINYTNAEVYGEGATSGWAQGKIKRGTVTKQSDIFTATA